MLLAVAVLSLPSDARAVCSSYAHARATHNAEADFAGLSWLRPAELANDFRLPEAPIPTCSGPRCTQPTIPPVAAPPHSIRIEIWGALARFGTTNSTSPARFDAHEPSLRPIDRAERIVRPPRAR
jgi:hypothetical protein